VKILLERLARERELLRPSIRHCAARARERGRRQWFSVRFSVSPRDVLADFMSARGTDAFYWEEPSRDLSILGLGRLATIEGGGADRFPEASSSARSLFADLRLHDLDDVDPIVRDDRPAMERGPLLLGGFAFHCGEVSVDSEWHSLGTGRLILPEVVIVVRKGRAWVSRTCSFDPDDQVDDVLDRLCSTVPYHATPAGVQPSADAIANDLAAIGEREETGPEIRVQADRSHRRYLAGVEAALEAIAAGKFEKVVLARSLRVMADYDFDLFSFLVNLREIYPSCVILSVRERDCWFVSATPEPLVALGGDRVTTAAIAGSAPRGSSPEEEARYSALLFESEKERVEHEVVEHSIRHALEEVCGPLTGPSEPRLLKLEGIQHLETPLRGRLLPKWRDELGVLDLVGALHPTPAVGGTPGATALDWIEQHESLDRGWYAGPVGYVDANGDGEFRVALRSALLRRRSARLFAGAGIVSNSVPHRELAETRLKLRALLAPLTEI